MIIRRLANDSAIYGGADLVTKILAFFAFPITAAALSPKAFGALELISTVTALLGLAISCGLNSAVQRFYWDKDVTPTMQPAIVTSGFLAQVWFGVTAVIAGLAALPFVLPLIKAHEWPLTWIALAAALLVMVFSQWIQFILDVIRLHLAPWHFFVVALSSRVATVAFGLAAVVCLGLGIDGLLGAQAIVLILVLPLGLWLIRRDFQAKRLELRWVRELIVFGYPFIFAGLAYWLFGAIDRWMLAYMTTVEEVGVYSVAFRFASVVLFISAAFGQAWSPVAMKIRTDHPEQYKSIYGQVLLLLIFVMLVVGGGVALFSGEVIRLTMPSDYHASALPLSIVCFGIILQATQQITAVGISIEKQTYLFARIAWMGALVNVIANWLLIPTFGAAGAAWGTLISYIVITSAYLYYTQRLHPIDIQWSRLLVFASLGTVVAFVSVVTAALEPDWKSILWKILLAVLCLYCGWKVLPLRSINSISRSPSSVDYKQKLYS
jgi:O-antigen/teichoic acid export membrane protein